MVLGCIIIIYLVLGAYLLGCITTFGDHLGFRRWGEYIFIFIVINLCFGLVLKTSGVGGFDGWG